MQNDKLLPCPFCGGEAIQERGERIIWYDESEEFECVHCTSCKCSVEGKTVEEVVNAWNTRKPMERIVEQLESLWKYNSEQAEIYHNVEKPDAHTREMKDLYIDRANCYGVAIRTVKGGVDNG